MFDEDEEFFVNQLNNNEDSFHTYYPSRLAIRRTLNDLKHQEIQNEVALDILKSKFLNEKKLNNRTPLGTSISSTYLTSNLGQQSISPLTRLNFSRNYFHENQNYNLNSRNSNRKISKYDSFYSKYSNNQNQFDSNSSYYDDSLMLKRRPTFTKLNSPLKSTISFKSQFDKFKFKYQSQFSSRSISQNTNEPLVSHRRYGPM
jgi:hypothetical protein